VPEGDTVWRTARRLHRALAGEVVTLSDLRFPSVATTDLRGATTSEVVARGKHILHRLDSGLTLHSHLRMDGQWRVEPTERAAGWLHRPTLRAAVGTQHWVALGLQLGMLDVLATAHEERVVGHLGPDLLGPDWDPLRATANLAASGQPIGAGLLDQRNLAGVGTFWASEALFLERLGPWTAASRLEGPQVAALVERVHRLIDVGKASAVQSSTGSDRRGESSYVHGRAGRPCRRCGTAVRVAMIGEPTRERTMFYCPGCQGGVGPTDDGRPRQPWGGVAGRRGPPRSG
jgi:endonuclease-8